MRRSKPLRPGATLFGPLTGYFLYDTVLFTAQSLSTIPNEGTHVSVPVIESINIASEMGWSHGKACQLNVIARRLFGQRTDLRVIHESRLHDLMVCFVQWARLLPDSSPQVWADAAVEEVSNAKMPGYRKACHIFKCDIDFALRELYTQLGINFDGPLVRQ